MKKINYLKQISIIASILFLNCSSFNHLKSNEDLCPYIKIMFDSLEKSNIHSPHFEGLDTIVFFLRQEDCFSCEIKHLYKIIQSSCIEGNQFKSKFNLHAIETYENEFLITKIKNNKKFKTIEIHFFKLHSNHTGFVKISTKEKKVLTYQIGRY
jgi:hypothetical protein